MHTLVLESRSYAIGILLVAEITLTFRRADSGSLDGDQPSGNDSRLHCLFSLVPQTLYALGTSVDSWTLVPLTMMGRLEQ